MSITDSQPFLRTGKQDAITTIGLQATGTS